MKQLPKKSIGQIIMPISPAANITSLRQHIRQKRGILTIFGCDEAAILFTAIISMADVTTLQVSFTIPVNCFFWEREEYRNPDSVIRDKG
jgi:hypothetical protein